VAKQNPVKPEAQEEEGRVPTVTSKVSVATVMPSPLTSAPAQMIAMRKALHRMPAMTGGSRPDLMQRKQRFKRRWLKRRNCLKECITIREAPFVRRTLAARNFVRVATTTPVPMGKGTFDPTAAARTTPTSSPKDIFTTSTQAAQAP
jgi:hypothetical protein